LIPSRHTNQLFPRLEVCFHIRRCPFVERGRGSTGAACPRSLSLPFCTFAPQESPSGLCKVDWMLQEEGERRHSPNSQAAPRNRRRRRKFSREKKLFCLVLMEEDPTGGGGAISVRNTERKRGKSDQGWTSRDGGGRSRGRTKMPGGCVAETERYGHGDADLNCSCSL